MSDAIVSFEKVNKWYGNAFHVLRDIDLTVARGERIVICGPSGSGKSTLIRCINALEEYQEGRITVDGTLLSDDVKAIEAVRKQVGMVFQQFNLFPHLTALRNVTLAQEKVLKRSSNEAVVIARENLERVGLAEKADSYPAQLSGGQQQRVAIARALVNQPSLIYRETIPVFPMRCHVTCSSARKRFHSSILHASSRTGSTSHLLNPLFWPRRIRLN